MTTQATLQCLPVNYSDQLQPSSQTCQSQGQEMMSFPANWRLKKWCHPQPITGSGNDAVPGCYTVNIPYIRAFIIPAGGHRVESEESRGQGRRKTEQSEDKKDKDYTLP